MEREQAIDARHDSRRELLAWLATDIRAPLATIAAIVDALERSAPVDAETVTRLYTAAHQLARMVDDLVEASCGAAEDQCPDWPAVVGESGDHFELAYRPHADPEWW